MQVVLTTWSDISITNSNYILCGCKLRVRVNTGLRNVIGTSPGTIFVSVCLQGTFPMIRVQPRNHEHTTQWKISSSNRT